MFFSPDRAARVAAAGMAGPECEKHSVRYLQEHQPQVLRAQQTQWQPSYLVPPNCRVTAQLVSTEVVPASHLPHLHVTAHKAGDPCSEADLPFGQEREIDGVGAGRRESTLSFERVWHWHWQPVALFFT